nr:uncharacterized protein LOC117986952 [Maniola hyperantus]
MTELYRNTFPYLKILGCLLITFSLQSRAKPTNLEKINLREISLLPMRETLFVPANENPIQTPHSIRRRRQSLLPRLFPLRSRKRLSPLPLLPPRRPLLLSMITSAVSDGIRTYPYYLQEIPLAFGETIVDSVREAAPHLTGALKDISPGIMEIMNMIPEKRLGPIQKIMKNIPIVIHETMQVAIDPVNDYEDSESSPEILSSIEEPSKKNPRYREVKPLKTLQETYLNTKEKLNTKFEETKQKAHYLYQNLIQDYEDLTPKKKARQYETPKLVKKASQKIAPVINNSLTEVAHLPQKIKKLVKQMKQ